MRNATWGLSIVLLSLLMVGFAGAQGPAPGEGIYVADAGNYRIVRINDMTGTGWATLSGPADGQGANQVFSSLKGISIDTAGRIYAADYHSNRIIRVNDMTGAGWTTFGSAGSGISQLRGPLGVFVDGAERIYVYDGGNDRIVRIDDMTGAGWTTLSALGARKVNQALGTVRPSSGVFVDRAGRVYFTDYLIGRIARSDDMTGAKETTFGTRGSGVNQFSGPNTIFLDAAARIYITDYFNHRIVRINDMSGKGWTTFGTKGSGVNQFTGPSAIFVDGAGRIYVTDEFNNRIVRIDDMTGAGWTAFGSKGKGVNQFQSPTAIFIR